MSGFLDHDRGNKQRKTEKKKLGHKINKKLYVERMPLFHKTFYIWVVLCIYKVKKPGSASR
jgi:hypothetical protein